MTWHQQAAAGTQDAIWGLWTLHWKMNATGVNETANFLLLKFSHLYFIRNSTGYGHFALDFRVLNDSISVYKTYACL